MEFISGAGVLPELVLVILVTITLFFVFAAIEYLYNMYYQMTLSRTTLIPQTVSSTSVTTIHQDPTIKKSKTLFVSDNERSGIEFSYTFYVFINPSTFTTGDPNTTFKTIFYKGYGSTVFPLMGPGVFMNSNTNTMHIIMNSFSNWRKSVDVPNIPIGKWVHIGIVYRGNSLEVYVNGNLDKKMAFYNGDLPYQNFQNINIFSKTRFSLAPYAIKLDDSQPQLTQASGDPSASTIQSSTTSPLRFNVSGPISGYLSRLNYFRYAIGFAEIQMMMKEGASSTIENADTLANSPPYLQDTWWTTTY